MARIAIFGSKADPQVAKVRALALLGGHEVRLFALEGWMGDGSEGHSLRIDGSGLSATFGSERLDDVQGLWLRHLPSPFLQIAVGEGLPALDREEVFVSSMNARERAATLLAVVDALGDAGKNVINPPASGLGIQNKPSQLARMARAGVRVPETLVTDDPAAALSFAEGRRVIFKPTTGGALAQELNDEMKAGLHEIVRAPVIFQAFAEGEDVRVTMIDDRILSAVVIETPEGTLDFRSSTAYAAGEGTYREVGLPQKIERALCDARRAVGLRFAGIDIRIPKDRPEGYAVLEANPSPTYLDIEDKMDQPITEGLIDGLVS